MAAKNTSVDSLTKGVEFLFKKNNVEYIKGTAAFSGEHEIQVSLVEGGEQTLRAKNIIIATGSEATPFPGLKIDEKRVVTSTGAIALDKVPKKMVVIGGGIIGLEMVRHTPRNQYYMTADSICNRVPSGRGWAPRLRSLSFWGRLAGQEWTLKYLKWPRRFSPSKA